MTTNSDAEQHQAPDPGQERQERHERPLLGFANSLRSYPTTRYHLVMKQASDGIAIYDVRGAIIEANTRACEMLGYAREELLRLNLTQILDPEELARTPIRFEALKTGKILMAERTLVCKDGLHFPAEISARVLEDGSDVQAILLRIQARDISSKSKVESPRSKE